MNPTTLSDFWATRPLRRRSGRKVAGVCAGFGARYQVDPTLVRVAFVVATVFGGAGVLIYLIACVVLPSEHSRGASARERRDTSFRFGSLIPLGILAIVLAAWHPGGTLAVAAVGWTVGGFGMGLGIASGSLAVPPPHTWPKTARPDRRSGRGVVPSCAARVTGRRG